MYKQPYVKLAITIKLDEREKTCAPRAFRVHRKGGRREGVARGGGGVRWREETRGFWVIASGGWA